MPSVANPDPKQTDGKQVTINRREGVETRNVLCATCDISCNVVAEVQKGRVVRVRSSDNPIFRDNICTVSYTHLTLPTICSVLFSMVAGLLKKQTN